VHKYIFQPSITRKPPSNSIFENYANYFYSLLSRPFLPRPPQPYRLTDSTVRPISTSIVHKPKQLVTESQITLSCEVEGSVPDTDIKWTQNNRVFERGSVSIFKSNLKLFKLLVSTCVVYRKIPISFYYELYVQYQKPREQL
jgi:hypothetical protein